jgi:hypothetical protein
MAIRFSIAFSGTKCGKASAIILDLLTFSIATRCIATPPEPPGVSSVKLETTGVVKAFDVSKERFHRHFPRRYNGACRP